MFNDKIILLYDEDDESNIPFLIEKNIYNTIYVEKIPGFDNYNIINMIDEPISLNTYIFLDDNSTIHSYETHPYVNHRDHYRLKINYNLIKIKSGGTFLKNSKSYYNILGLDQNGDILKITICFRRFMLKLKTVEKIVIDINDKILSISNVRFDNKDLFYFMTINGVYEYDMKHKLLKNKDNYDFFDHDYEFPRLLHDFQGYVKIDNKIHEDILLVSRGSMLIYLIKKQKNQYITEYGRKILKIQNKNTFNFYKKNKLVKKDLQNITDIYFNFLNNYIYITTTDNFYVLDRESQEVTQIHRSDGKKLILYKNNNLFKRAR